MLIEPKREEKESPSASTLAFSPAPAPATRGSSGWSWVWALAVFCLQFGSVLDSARAGAIRPGFSGEELPANDDDSTAAVPIGFEINFFGERHTDLFVNNNGNVTFDAELADFTPEPLVDRNLQIIAAFWADVDTTNVVSGLTRYSSGGENINGHRAFGVTWKDVGYYQSQGDKLNSFQLIIIEREDTGPGNFDIELNYDRLEWETGESENPGGGGLGGNSARAGYANGVDDDRTFELQGSGVNGAFLDSNRATGLIYGSLNSGVAGRYVFRVRNGNFADNPPVAIAGADLAANLSASVSLDGSASYDPEEAAITFSWVQRSGLSVTLVGASTASPTFVAPAVAGSLSFELTVSDGPLSATDNVTIFIESALDPEFLYWAGAGRNVASSGGGIWDVGTTLSWRNGTPAGTLATWTQNRTAIFAGSNGGVVDTRSGISADGIQFTADAGAFDLMVAGINSLTGSGISNESSSTQTLHNNRSILWFSGNASAGAGSKGSQVAIFSDGLLAFSDSATLGAATLTTSGAADFMDSSSAGTATIISSGQVNFAGSATAGSAVIGNDDLLTFDGDSGAGAAVITNRGQCLIRGNAHTFNLAIFNNLAAGSIDVDSTNAGGVTVGTLTNAADSTLNVYGTRLEVGRVTLIDGNTLSFNLAPGGTGLLNVTNSMVGSTGFGGTSITIYDTGGVAPGRTIPLLDWSTATNVVDVDVSDFVLQPLPGGFGGVLRIAGGKLILDVLSPVVVPTVVTGSADGLTKTTANVSGGVNSNGAATSVYFEVGTSALYDSSTPPVSLLGGISTVPALASLTGLSPGTEYHYRIVATNFVGTSFGDDQTFVTGADPEPPDTFDGLLADKDGNTGSVSFNLNRDGSFSGKISLTGVRNYSFRGAFDAVNRFTIDLPGAASVAGELVNGTIRIVVTQGPDLYDGTLVSSLVGRSEEGSYTMLLPPSPSSLVDPSAPHGTGYAVVTIDRTGRIRCVGALADGTKFGMGSGVRADGTFPFYARLYPGRVGQLGGVLSLRDLPTSDFEGVLVWVKPGSVLDPLYPAGFIASIDAVGSSFAKPKLPTGILQLSASSTVLLEFTEGNLTAPQTGTARIRNVGAPVVQRPMRSLTLSRRTGLFTGFFVFAPSGGSKVYRGVVLQKQNRGEGFFLGTDASGKVTVTP